MIRWPYGYKSRCAKMQAKPPGHSLHHFARFWIACICGGVFLTTTLAAQQTQEVFHYLRLDSLELSEPKELEENDEFRLGLEWRFRAYQSPWVVLTSEGTAYLRFPERFHTNPESMLQHCHLAVRVLSSMEQVEGKLYLPKIKGLGYVVYEFAYSGMQSSENASRKFHETQEWHYRRLIENDYAGAGWFRHRAGNAYRILHGKNQDRLVDQGNRRRNTNDPELYDLFSGGYAISENLQLDRNLVLEDEEGERLIPIDSLSGITIQEFDWKKLAEGLEFQPDSLAQWIPVDQYGVFFPNFQAFLEIMDMFSGESSSLLGGLSPAHEDYGLSSRYQKQLGVELDQLVRALGPQMVQQVAITGSDPYLATGSDLAVLLQCSNAEPLANYLHSQYLKIQDSEGEDLLDRGTIRSVEYVSLRSPFREYSSYFCRKDNLILLTNSLVQIERFADLLEEKSTPLIDSSEYKFFRHRYAQNDEQELAFVMLTDATIRRWGGPRWRIGAARRLQAMAVLSEYQARFASDLISGTMSPGTFSTEYELPGKDELGREDFGIYSKEYGHLGFWTPIAELNIRQVSQDEADAYQVFLDNYQNNWEQFFDPIAIRFSKDQNQLKFDLSVVPLIARSEFRNWIQLTEGVILKPSAGDLHPEAIMHWIFALNKDSGELRSWESMFQSLFPNAAPRALGWVGESVAFYADQDDFWMRWMEAEDPSNFIWNNFMHLPMGMIVEVEDGFQLTAFLVGLRAGLHSMVPNMLQWEPLKYRETEYMAIRPTESQVVEEMDPIALHYLVLPNSILFTMREDLVQRAVDRHLDGVADLQNSTWLESSVGMKLRQGALAAIQMLWQTHLDLQMRIESWKNIPILNEWKSLFPEEDPVEVHRRIWGRTPNCPGGGRYEWNPELRSMQSSVYGCPGNPISKNVIPSALKRISAAEFGITFEMDGLRAQAVLDLVTER